jgi:hypothetical protein
VRRETNDRGAVVPIKSESLIRNRAHQEFLIFVVESAPSAKWRTTAMTDLIGLVMEAAATELLHEQAIQIDQEVRDLLAEIERAPVEECCSSTYMERFLALLERRGQIARKALVIFEELPSTPPRAPETVLQAS